METLNGIDVDIGQHRKAEIHTCCMTRFRGTQRKTSGQAAGKALDCGY